MAPPPPPPPGKKSAWSAAETEALRRLIRQRSPAGSVSGTKRPNVYGCLNCTTDASHIEPRCTSTSSETPRAVGPVTALCTETYAVPSLRKTRNHRHSHVRTGATPDVSSVHSFLSSTPTSLQFPTIPYGFSQNQNWNGGSLSSEEAAEQGWDPYPYGGESDHAGGKRQKLGNPGTSHSLRATPPIRKDAPALLAVPYRTRPKITIPLAFSDLAAPSRCMDGTDGTMASASSGSQIRPSISPCGSISSEDQSVHSERWAVTNTTISGNDFFQSCMDRRSHVPGNDDVIDSIDAGLLKDGSLENLNYFSSDNIVTRGTETIIRTEAHGMGVVEIDAGKNDVIRLGSGTVIGTEIGTVTGTGADKERAAVSGSHKHRKYNNKRSLLSYLSAGWPKLKTEGSAKVADSSAKNLSDSEVKPKCVTDIETLSELLHTEQSTYSELEEVVKAANKVTRGEVISSDPTVYAQLGFGSVAENGKEFLESLTEIVTVEADLNEGAGNRVCPEIAAENNEFLNYSNTEDISTSSTDANLGPFLASNFGPNFRSNSESNSGSNLDSASNLIERMKSDLMSNLDQESNLDLGLLDIPLWSSPGFTF